MKVQIVMLCMFILFLTGCQVVQQTEEENEIGEEDVQEEQLTKEEAENLLLQYFADQDKVVEISLVEESEQAYLFQTFLIMEERSVAFHWHEVEKQTKELTEKTITYLKQESDFKIAGDVLLSAVANKRMDIVASMVDDEKGLLFVPYLYVQEDAQVFNQQEVEDFFETNVTYTWGHYDGTGDPITLSPREYFDEFIYDRDYLKADEVVYNEIVGRGNTIDNFDDVFKEYQLVEYHLTGTETYSGMDWGSLYFVFDVSGDGNLRLIAIVHNEWTI